MSARSAITLDAKIDWVKDRINKTIAIAWERVVAHDENPGYYQIPSDPKSLENAFHRLFEALPRKGKKDVIEKVNKTLKAGRAARERIYGDLVDINFRSTTPVVDQVKIKPVPENVKFTDKDMIEARNRLKLKLARPKKPAQAAEATEVGFDVTTLTCVNPTDIRKDELNLGGFGIDNLGGGLNVSPFFVGKFKKGETLGLGAKGRLFNFKLTQGEFPKLFTAAISIVEKDWVRDDELFDAMEVACFSIFLATYPLIVIASVAPVPGARVILLALLSVMVLSAAVGIGLQVAKDDVSFFATDVLVLEGPVPPGTTFDRAPLTLKLGAFKSEYSAAIRWVTA